jgi:hypothetical protein
MKKSVLFASVLIISTLLLVGCTARNTPGAGLEVSRIGSPLPAGSDSTNTAGKPIFIITATPTPSSASIITDKPSPQPTPSPAKQPALASDPALAEKASVIINAIKNKEFSKLIAQAYPGRGICFSPTLQVLPQSQCLNPNSLSDYAQGKNKQERFNWEVGKSDRTKLTFGEYLSRYVYSRDFATSSDEVTLNPNSGRGSVKSNIARFYSNCKSVEYYVRGSGENDWRAVTLVFQQYRGDWRLVAIASDQP